MGQGSGYCKKGWHVFGYQYIITGEEEKGRVYGVEGCILKEDLARQKESLLKEQFTGGEVADVKRNRFYTKEIMEEFVKRCVEEIPE